MGIANRLGKFHDYLKKDGYGGRNVFEAAIGKKDGYLTTAIKKETEIGSNVLEHLAKKFPELNLDWLITGEGDMLRNSKETSLSFSTSEFKLRGYSPFFSSLEVSAGDNYNFALSHGEEPSSWIKIPGVTVEAYFPIFGCSMEPVIKSGDVIGVASVENWDRLDPDKIYMVVTAHDRMIKHLYIDDEDKNVIWAVSENYPKFKLCVDEIKKVFQVVWYGRLA